MNDGAILDLAKQSGLVSQTYTIESGNVSWPRLKEFAELVEARALAEAYSAAPELLDALEALCSRLPCNTKSPNAYDTYHAKLELDLARAAIAKARGEA